MVSTWESLRDAGTYLEVEFQDGPKRKWELFKFSFDDNGNKQRGDTLQFELENGSRQSVEGHKIKYYFGEPNEFKESLEDTVYFLGDKFYSKRYSFGNTKEEDGFWKQSKLNAIRCRVSPMQLALYLDDLDDPKKKIPEEDELNGFYRFKPVKGIWGKSKSDFVSDLRGKDLYGYDIVYHNKEKDVLFVDSNGDIYSKNYSWATEETENDPKSYLLAGKGTHPPYYNPNFTNTSARKSSAKKRRTSTVTPSASSAKKKLKTSPAPAATPLIISKPTEHSIQRQPGGMVTNERLAYSNDQQPQSSPHIESIVAHASNDNCTRSPFVCRRCSDNGSPSEEEENKKKERETAKKVAKLEKDIKKKDNRKLELIELKKIVQVEQFKLKGDIYQEKEGLKLVGDLLLFLKNKKAYNENEWGETKLKGAFKHIRTHFDPGCENDKKTLEAINELEEEYPDDLYKKVPFRGVFENDDDFKEYEASLKRAEAKIIPILYSALAKYKDTKKVEKNIKITMESLKRERNLRQRRLEKLSGPGSTNNQTILLRRRGTTKKNALKKGDFETSLFNVINCMHVFHIFSRSITLKVLLSIR